MPDQFIGEREFFRSEFDRTRPIGLIVVGLLLGFAFGRHKANPQIDRAAAKLDRVP